MFRTGPIGRLGDCEMLRIFLGCEFLVAFAQFCDQSLSTREVEFETEDGGGGFMGATRKTCGMTSRRKTVIQSRGR